MNSLTGFTVVCVTAATYREMVMLLLGEHFAEYVENDDTIEEFKRCMGIAVRHLHGRDPDEYLFKALSDLLSSRWTNPVLNDIMNGKDIERDVGM